MKGRWRSWTSMLMSVIATFTTASAILDTNETSALLAFKNSINDQKGKLGDWKGNDPCGSSGWTGITCKYSDLSNYSHVSEIHIMKSNLAGTLSPELGNFPYLQTLNLMWNQITGSIPPELGNLKSLQLLLLNGNALTGSIPSELGNLTTMVRLQLDNNNLNGTIPSSLGDLTYLKHLHLNNNSLTGSIPVSFGRNDSHILHILVDNNNLTGPLPSSLGVLPSLTIIQADNNPIGGSVPPEWTKNPSLMKLSLRNCSLDGSVPDLTAATNLTYLDLSINKLEGPFPTNFSSKLITIDVSSNNLGGEIPEEVGDLQDMQALQLAFNHFNGSIPDTLGSAASFQNTTQQIVVDLRNNSLTGINLEIENAAQANNNVSVRLYGNPICDSNGLISDSYKVQFCIDNSNQTEDNAASSSVPSCGNCNSPNMSVQDSSGKCRCATPIKLEIRLKSPSFTFFEHFSTEFFSLMTSVLNLTDSQVHIDKLEWQAGPRLYMLIYLFPTNDTFDKTEYQHLFSYVANWDLSAGTEWALSVIGPYELLSFSEVIKAPSSGLSKGSIAGIALGSIAISSLSALVVLCYARRKWTKLPKESFSERSLKMMPPGLKLAGVKAFTFEEVKRATNNFHHSTELGRGGYGHVYKGLLQDGTAVAVKRADGSSLQGSDQFYTEIELLSRVHHRNLVSLIGFCNDQGEQMLIYEFMPGGNLRDHLTPTEELDYAARMRIASGTAKGILYLHTEADPPIFHRDIKASNILLDKNLNPKVADFGLSKLAPTPDMSGGTPEGISTNVRGTPGYLDPEYFMTNKLTDKSDVYSFGVVLLELVTGLLPIAHGKNIVRETQDAVRAGTVQDLVDPCMGPYPPEGIEALLKLALSCVRTDQGERPQMVEVTRELDLIMRETLVPECPSACNSSNASSFSKASDRWLLKRNTPLQHDISWMSTDELLESRSQDIPKQSIEMEPR